MFRMMLSLMFDVMSYNISVGSAYAECAIALLPFEIKSVLTQPAGGVGLENLNAFAKVTVAGSAMSR